jgi:outer membrane receptor for ferrienterochelin and colicins
LSLDTDKWENDFSLNRYSSGGYKLNPQSVSQTVPEFDNYTLNYKTSLELSDRLRVDADIRYFTESQRNLESIVENEEISAESSWAVNFGFDMNTLDFTRVRISLFRNNVSDLIETAPVARKTNGQSVFTYFNVDEVFTQGIETELRLNFNRNLTGSLGYQYLDARRKIERERRVQNEQGEVVERTETSFQPMFNRSTHSGNVKLFYENESGRKRSTVP